MKLVNATYLFSLAWFNIKCVSFKYRYSHARKSALNWCTDALLKYLRIQRYQVSFVERAHNVDKFKTSSSWVSWRKHPNLQKLWNQRSDKWPWRRKQKNIQSSKRIYKVPNMFWRRFTGLCSTMIQVPLIWISDWLKLRSGWGSTISPWIMTKQCIQCIYSLRSLDKSLPRMVWNLTISRDKNLRNQCSYRNPKELSSVLGMLTIWWIADNVLFFRTLYSISSSFFRAWSGANGPRNETNNDRFLTDLKAQIIRRRWRWCFEVGKASSEHRVAIIDWRRCCVGSRNVPPVSFYGSFYDGSSIQNTPENF